MNRRAFLLAGAAVAALPVALPPRPARAARPLAQRGGAAYFTNAELRSLGERYERRPSRHAEAGDEEHDTRGKLLKARMRGTRAGADGCHGDCYGEVSPAEQPETHITEKTTGHAVLLCGARFLD